MGKGKLIIAAIMILLLGVALDVSALPKVGTTTVSSGQVPTAANWNTYLNRAENWINTNLLNSGNTFTIVGGDSALFNGTAVVDSFRVTGFFDLATHILPRATRTYRIGLPTALLWALHADTVRAAIADFDSLHGTTIFGSTPIARPASDLSGQVGLPTFRFNSFTGDTARVQVMDADTLANKITFSDTWRLVPKTDNTGYLGTVSKRIASTSVDTVRGSVFAFNAGSAVDSTATITLSPPEPVARRVKAVFWTMDANNNAGTNRFNSGGILGSAGNARGAGGFHVTGYVTATEAATSAGDTDANRIFRDSDDSVNRVKKTSGAAINTATRLIGVISYADVDVSSVHAVRVSTNATDANFTGSPSSMSIVLYNSSGAVVNIFSLLTAGKSVSIDVSGLVIE